MSPSWRKRAGVFVEAADVRPPAQPLQRAEVDATLSNQLVRYALVPDVALLRNDAERQAAAVHALAQTYGETARGWDVAIDRAGAFPQMLVAGIDAGLRERIEASLREAGAASVNLQPALARAIAAAGVPGAGWVAVLEPARIVVAAFASGALLAVRSQRVRGALADDLLVLLQQSRLLDGLPAEADDVRVCGEGLETAITLPGFRAVAVPLDFHAPQRAARRSDPVQLAFGRAPSLVRGPELAWLAIAALVFGLAAWQYAQVAGQRNALQSTLAEAERFTQRQAGRSLDPNRPDARALAAEVVRANAVAARLQVPWEALFTDLELAAGDGVTLTGLEPEGGMRRLRITGEARRFEDLTQYLRRLEGTPALHNVFLTGHEQRDRGLTFTLTADWVRSDDTTRP